VVTLVSQVASLAKPINGGGGGGGGGGGQAGAGMRHVIKINNKAFLAYQ
jgi:hypothetical protein